jgi:hypothetical protein
MKQKNSSLKKQPVALLPSAINCTDDATPFDVSDSLSRMAALLGRGGESDFERCLEMKRAKASLKSHEWVHRYLPHPAVDVKVRKAHQMVEIATMPDGRALCSTYGFTKALQLHRIKHQDQRDAFIAEYPPEKQIVEELRELIDRILGHQRTPRTATPRGSYNQSIWAAGNLYLDPTNLDQEQLSEHYDLLAAAFSTSPRLQPLLAQLDAAKALLTGTSVVVRSQERDAA